MHDSTLDDGAVRDIVVPLDVLDGWPPDDLADIAGPRSPSCDDELALWRLTVACSADPALVVSADGCVAAISPHLAELLDRPVDRCAGLPLAGGLLDLLPFGDLAPVGGADGGTAVYAERVPPLWSLRTAAPARSLIRVRRTEGAATFDVVASPLHGGTAGARRIIGALAFFSPLD